MSFVPTSEFPDSVTSWAARARVHAAVLADNATVAECVPERIRRKDRCHRKTSKRETGRTKDWFGMPENSVRAVLEAYTSPE